MSSREAHAWGNDGGRRNGHSCGWRVKVRRAQETTQHHLKLHQKVWWNSRCKACTVDSTHDNKQCIEHHQEIFDRGCRSSSSSGERAGAEVSATQGQQASASSGDAPPVVSSAAAETTTPGTPVGADAVPMENTSVNRSPDTASTSRGGRGDAS